MSYTRIRASAYQNRSPLALLDRAQNMNNLKKKHFY